MAGRAIRKAYEYYLRARQLHNEQSDTTTKQSIELFRRAVQEDPEFAKGHAGLAAALGDRDLLAHDQEPGATEEAMRAARRAHELAPDLPEAWLAQANLHSASLQPELADLAFEKALAGNPDSFEALLLYARHAFSAGQTAKAAELFERAQQIEPEDYQVAALLAGSVRKLGDPDRTLKADRAALALLERRIELYPDDTRALHLAAGAYAKLGQQGARNRGRRTRARAAAARVRDAVQRCLRLRAPRRTGARAGDPRGIRRARPGQFRLDPRGSGLREPARRPAL